MRPYIILDSVWFTNKDGIAGIVAVKTNTHEPMDILEWKAYIGFAHGASIEGDEQYISAWGNGLHPREAHGFFPSLDIEKYKKQ